MFVQEIVKNEYRGSFRIDRRKKKDSKSYFRIKKGTMSLLGGMIITRRHCFALIKSMEFDLKLRVKFVDMV